MGEGSVAGDGCRALCMPLNVRAVALASLGSPYLGDNEPVQVARLAEQLHEDRCLVILGDIVEAMPDRECLNAPPAERAM